MIAHVFVLLIRAYQILISPFTRASCRFHPTCSQYAIHAIQHHGLLKGIQLATKRLFRCHPFNQSFGYDPVDVNESLKKS